MSGGKKKRQEHAEVHEDPLSEPDTINNLNNDCLGMIFQLLPLMDKVKMTQVCKRWRDLSDLAWEGTKSLDFGKPQIKSRYDKSTVYQELPVPARTLMGVAKLLERCGRMVHEVKFSHPTNGSILPHISKHCPNLRVLSMLCHYHHWGKTMCFSKLQCLEMEGTVGAKKVVPAGLFHSLSRETLLSLHLTVRGPENPPGLPPEAAMAVQKFEKLTTIKLQGFILGGDMMRAIAQRSSLQRIDLSGPLTEGKVPSFEVLKNLEHLELSVGLSDISDETLLDISTNCQQMKSLKVSGITISDIGVSSLASLTKLRKLSLYGDMRITDASLSKLHSLESLWYTGSKHICDHGIITLIKNASNLTSLSFEQSALTQQVLYAANQAMLNRKNNVQLRFVVGRRLGRNWMANGKAPLLHVYC